MNKKGFTLIEILAVVVILAMLGTILTFVINGYINNSRDDLYETQKRNIEEAARAWGAEHIEMLPTQGSENVEVTLEQLVRDGFLDEVPSNPRTKEPFSLETTVVISYDGTKFKYSVNLVE